VRLLMQAHPDAKAQGDPGGQATGSSVCVQ
jgi:hypothetical protein